MTHLLGIDVGTTAVKSALFTVDGGLVDIARLPCSVSHPREGWAEQDPDDWWNAVRETVNAVVSRHPGARIAAVSLSTQGGCLIPLDGAFRPLSPAVSWLDRRACEVADIVESSCGSDELYRTCGWGNTGGLGLPLVVWFREKRPDLFDRARYFASTADYLAARLTGRFALDYTNYAMTLFFDLAGADVSQRALACAGIGRGALPECLPSGRPLGALKDDVARELGLPEGVMLVSGAHDQYCASIGAGAVKTGDCVLSAGTAWVMVATAAGPLFDGAQTIHPCVHVLEGRYGLLTSVASGGDSLNWYRRTFRPDASFAALSEEALTVEPGAANPLFIPRFVSNSGNAAIVNLDRSHTAAHVTRAVFEGVALANRGHLETFARNGVNVNRLIMIGGGAGSAAWPRIAADVSKTPIVIPEQTEAACAGAAMLAGVGAGVYASLDEAQEAFHRGGGRSVAPHGGTTVIYDRLFETFMTMLDSL